MTDDDLWADDPADRRGGSGDDPDGLREARLRDAGIDPRDRDLERPREELRNIANYQRGILWCILANLVGLGLFVAGGAVAGADPAGGAGGENAAATAISAVALVWVAIAAIASLVFCFLLGKELYGWPIGLLLAAFSWVSCVGLLVLLILSSAATKRLKASGIPVGLMGAKRGTI